MTIFCMESLVDSSPAIIFPDTHGVLLTFGPLRRHRLLIASNATANIAVIRLFTVYGEDKVIGLRLKFKS